MLFLDALAGKNSSKRPPVWLMRQAGRYMHEYQAYRARYDFLSICNTPELICEVTHLPINAFGFDAAILFSDILIILQALGFDLKFYEDIGPVIGNPIKSADDIHYKDVLAQLEPVLQGIRLLKGSLKVPLIGFAGAPFTVASYLIGRDLVTTKKWLYSNPDSFDKVLDVLARCTIDYLNAQIAAGCDAIQIFDSWAMHLAPQQFERFVKKPLEKIVKGVKGCPVVLFSRGEGERLGAIGPQGLSLDWTQDLAKVRKMHPKIALQGNLDPDILRTDKKTVTKEVNTLLDSMKGDPAFIFNLGHGVHKDTPREHVEALVACVKGYHG